MNFLLTIVLCTCVIIHIVTGHKQKNIKSENDDKEWIYEKPIIYSEGMSLKETHRRHSIRKNRHPTYVITEVIKKGERGYMCNRQFFRTLQGANDCLMKLNKKHKRLVRSRPAPTIPPRSHSHRTPPPYQKPPPYRSRIPLKPLRSLSPPPIPPRPANRLQKKY